MLLDYYKSIENFLNFNNFIMDELKDTFVIGECSEAFRNYLENFNKLNS